jgi:hypothetical protein
MATEQNLILYLPFDESEGSAVAYDYSRGRHDAAVDGATFTKGKQGNCLHFDGNGTADIETNVITLSDDFTVLAWLKLPAFEDGITGLKIGLFCNTQQREDGYRVLWVDAPLETWGFLVIKKEGRNVSLYLDTQLMGTLELPATLTGFGLLQDVFGTFNAVADIDEVKAYNVALTDEEIEAILNETKQLEWYIDGVNFKDYGIHVESSQGLVDLPGLKTTPTIENDNYHGEMVDLSEKRYQPREITLNCWLKASGKMDFTERVKNLYSHFDREGTTRLMCSIHPTKPLVYDVYCPDGVQPEKKWHDDMMIGTFALKVREPDPVKRVVRHLRQGETSSTVSVAFKSSKLITVSWGDGTVDTVYGDHTGANQLTHTYTKNGTYYVLIGGVIEEITDFTTNGIIVWQRL